MKPLLFLILLLLIKPLFSQDSGLKLKVHKSKGYYFENVKGKNEFKKYYSSASWFSDGVAVVADTSLYGVIDSKGNQIIPQIYYDIYDFEQGIAKFQVVANGLFGLIRKNGEIIIEPTYEEIGYFENGFTIVKISSKVTNLVYNILDTNGKLLLDTFFTNLTITQINDTIICVTKDSELKISKNGIIQSINHLNKEKTNINEDSLLSFVEKSPGFIGGDEARMQFLIDNIHYPNIAIKTECSGIIYIGFVIEKDGSVSTARILRGACPSLNKESLRVIRSMPLWIPGEQRGQKVRTQFNMPLKFSLQ